MAVMAPIEETQIEAKKERERVGKGQRGRHTKPQLDSSSSSIDSSSIETSQSADYGACLDNGGDGRQW